MEAAKELNIELFNPSAEILETAFDVYITENQIKAHSSDVDEGLKKPSTTICPRWRGLRLHSCM
jgi:hypothetical protein